MRAGERPRCNVHSTEFRSDEAEGPFGSSSLRSLRSLRCLDVSMSGCEASAGVLKSVSEPSSSSCEISLAGSPPRPFLRASKRFLRAEWSGCPVQLRMQRKLREPHEARVEAGKQAGLPSRPASRAVPGRQQKSSRKGRHTFLLQKVVQSPTIRLLYPSTA